MGTVGFCEPIPPMVSAWTRGWGFVDEGIAGSVPASNTWSVANRCLWFPVYVPTACIATRMWWANGATVDGNVEAGLYYDGGWKPGGKYWTSGSIAQSGTTSVQFTNIDPDIRLDPGLWWVYLSSSSATATFMRCTMTAAWDELLRFQQTSVGPGSAPDPATPVESTSETMHLFGFSTNTVT